MITIKLEINIPYPVLENSYIQLKHRVKNDLGDIVTEIVTTVKRDMENGEKRRVYDGNEITYKSPNMKLVKLT